MLVGIEYFDTHHAAVLGNIYPTILLTLHGVVDVHVRFKSDIARVYIAVVSYVFKYLGLHDGIYEADKTLGLIYVEIVVLQGGVWGWLDSAKQ